MLVLTRKQGATIYGGEHLTEDLAATYDHKITVDRIVDTLSERYALVSIEDHLGTAETHKLDAANDEVFFDGIQLCLLGIRFIPSADEGENLIARLGINAPRSYRVVRDDAVKKTA